MKNYKEIVKEILNKVYNNELKPNDKLLSENALSIKYGVSRIVASRVFSELKKIGAVYSLPKKGNFIAEYFNGLLESVSDEYKIDKVLYIKMDYYDPAFFKEKNIYGNFEVFKKEYYKNDELIVKSEN
jgi:DNA-binding transcriptional regulator YhcF (GntR family)